MPTQTNFTAIPQTVLRQILPDIQSLSELKVLLAIIDRTAGFHRSSVPLKMETLSRITGLCPNAVRTGLKASIDRGLIEREDRPGFCAMFHLKLPVVPPTRERGETPDTAWGGSLNRKVLKDKEVKNNLLGTQEDSPVSSQKDSLTGIAQTIASKLQGQIPRRIKPQDILPSLRFLKAEMLNQNLDIDIEELVLEVVRRGMDANLRKNEGRCTIYSWKYFESSLMEALNREVKDREHRERIAEIQQKRDEIEYEECEKKRRENEIARKRWECLSEDSKKVLEREVLGSIPSFLRESVKRDREAKRRGPGLIALEQAIFNRLLRPILDPGNHLSVDMASHCREREGWKVDSPVGSVHSRVGG